MEHQVAEANHKLQGAPMSMTSIGWLLSLPVSLPASLMLSAWSKCFSILRRIFSPSVQGDFKISVRPLAKDADMQTELNMCDLDRFMAIMQGNEDAVCDHRQLLELARKDNQALRTELEGALARMSLLSQHNADLEGYKERLMGVLQDMVLPVFEQLTQATEADDVANISADVLRALHNTRHLFMEPSCATAEPSPAGKLSDGGYWSSPFCDTLAQSSRSPHSTTPARAFQGIDDTHHGDNSRGIMSTTQSNSAAKVLSFGSPTRTTAVMHILTDDF
ncbi:hypothetical protein VaNZ11_012896 [Volvox africanus]|uniref:Uncharacterized protein n=1 Tax=Volvox africanus TaxID=51714 RepID=A0ABQ5SF41_9CHLO|nr:hypothetical protein VaNZ11_012896 [Volvox africanus]